MNLCKGNDNYKWEVLLLLWFAFFVNQADRQLFNVILPLLKNDLNITDIQIGIIATVFNLTYALLMPVAGYLGDIYSKKWIIAASTLFWSVAVVFTGFSNGLFMLVFMRGVATSGGEAFFGPSNYSLLAAYHKESRSFAMSIHQTAYYLGLILSGYLAGYIGEHYGWRSSFFVFGIIGIVLGVILIFRLKDYKTFDTQSEDTSQKITFSESITVLIKTPTALMLSVSFSGLIFVLTAYLTWMPMHLYEAFDMKLSSAGFSAMFYTHFFAFLGIILAGRLSDKLAKKDPRIRLLIQGLGLLGGAPFIILMSNSTVLINVFIGLAGFGFARAFFDANTYAILYDVIPEKYQASATGLMLMTGFAVGSFAPMILGFLKPHIGLSLGMSFLSVLWIICGLLMLFAYRCNKRVTEKLN